MTKKINKNTVIIINVLLVIAIALVYFFILAPKVKQIKNISNQVKIQKNELEKKYQKGQSLKKSRENLNLIKENQNQILSAVIKQGEELNFITALEEAISGKNIEQNIKLSPPDLKKNKEMQSLELQISLKGNFIDIMRAINEMEGLNYYLIFERLDFIGGQIKIITDAETPYTGGKAILANLTGKIYWLPQK